MEEHASVAGGAVGKLFGATVRSVLKSRLVQMRILPMAFGVALVAALAAAPFSSAKAVAIVPYSGASLTIGNVVYSVDVGAASPCQYNITGAGQVGANSNVQTSAISCAAPNGGIPLDLQLTNVGGLAQLSAIGGNPYVSTTNVSGVGFTTADVTIKLAITALNGALLNGVTGSIAGTRSNPSSPGTSTFTSGITVSNSGGVGIGGINLSNTALNLSTSFAAQSFVGLTIDTRALLSGASGTNAVSTVTFGVASVPEPGTMGILALAGVLTMASRRRARRA